MMEGDNEDGPGTWKGFYTVFPVNVDDKSPATGGRSPKDVATNDPDIVAKWTAVDGFDAFGILCGKDNDLFVIDLDVDEAVDEETGVVSIVKTGEESLRQLGLGHLLDMPYVRTPSGGRHIYFRHFEGASNSVGKLGPRIDTKSEGGYVIAPTSITDAGDYVGYIPPEPPEVPESLREALIRHAPSAKEIASTREWDGDGPSTEEVRETLGWIHPDGGTYDDWLHVLMALHNQYGGAEEGHQLAVAWSKIGEKYKPGEVRSKWNSFTGDKTYGIKWPSVCSMAREKGADLSDISRRHRDGRAVAESAPTARPPAQMPAPPPVARTPTAPQPAAPAPAAHTPAPGVKVPLSALVHSEKMDDEIAALPVQKAGVVPERRSKPFRASTLEGITPPPMQWLVRDMFPGSDVTLLSGDGATGKSLIALQLAVAACAGRLWLDKPICNPSEKKQAIYMTAEDSKDELHRRLNHILPSLGVEYSELDGLELWSLAGEDAHMGYEGSHAMLPTPLYEDVDELAGDVKPSLIVLDTLADMNPSNENDRAKARQFIGLLRRLAIKHATSVVLIGHPSLTGLSSGTGTSGSTGWNNSVRSRLYLSRIFEDGEEPDPDARSMTTKKINAARVGEEIRLRWENHVFVNLDPVSTDRGEDREAKAKRVFLKLLREYASTGRTVNPSSSTGYAPTVFSQEYGNENVSRAMFKTAMSQLFSEGRITTVEEGPAYRRSRYIKELSTG